MSDFESAANLHPYLNRAYWDGHMVTDGHPTPVNPDSFTGPSFGATERFAKQALRDRLSLMHTYVPLQIYRNGDTFDPEKEEWAIGTVALFDRELLRTKIGHTFNPDAYTSLEIPSRPTDLHPNLHPGASGTVIYKDEMLGITYLRTIEWGVVAPTKKDRKAFQRTSTSMVWKSATGSVVAGPFLPETVPIEVGATRHTIRGDDRLTRTNILHICLVGSEKQEKRRASAFGFLGRWATGNA